MKKIAIVTSWSSKSKDFKANETGIKKPLVPQNNVSFLHLPLGPNETYKKYQNLVVTEVKKRKFDTFFFKDCSENLVKDLVADIRKKFRDKPVTFYSFSSFELPWVKNISSFAEVGIEEREEEVALVA
ncbi:MAG TPA: hypothetical protein VL576_01675 [Candidatus Paceibacterota bacterium]|jgi:hypothetical protein|nr:hypothetical protein [Candidatus Paceibacterota bacterium]